MAGDQKFLSLLCLLCLVGCATAAQRRATEIRTINTATTKEVKACVDTVQADPAYASLWTHVTKGGPASLEQLADQSLITEADKRSYLAYRSAIQPCVQLDLDRWAKIDAELLILHQKLQSDDDALRVRLIRREISWGEFTTDLAQNLSQTNLALAQRSRQIDNQLQQQNQAELAQRAAAAEAFSAAVNQMNQQQQQQQLINQLNRPVTTNCNRFGNTVNCTSY